MPAGSSMVFCPSEGQYDTRLGKIQQIRSPSQSFSSKLRLVAGLLAPPGPGVRGKLL